MVSQEEKDKVKRQMFIVLLIGFLIFSYFLSSTERDCNNSEVYCYDDTHPIDALIQKTKEIEENCGKYVLYEEGIDKYGEKWITRGYYILTDKEWEELRKYQNAHFFFETNEAPIFHYSK